MATWDACTLVDVEVTCAAAETRTLANAVGYSCDMEFRIEER
jgi:hypothetical protein